MVLIDDVVVSIAAAVTTATLVVLVVLLARYRALVKDATKSTDLAKNLWDAMNERLTTQDSRIVDMMAKFEVYSVRKGVGLPPPARPPPTSTNVPRSPETRAQEMRLETSHPVSQASQAPSQSGITTRERENQILRALLDGPRTSNDIRAVLDVSREHNARLLKALYGRGLLLRNDEHKPFVYEITEAGRRYLGAA